MKRCIVLIVAWAVAAGTGLRAADDRGGAARSGRPVAEKRLPFDDAREIVDQRAKQGVPAAVGVGSSELEAWISGVSELVATAVWMKEKDLKKDSDPEDPAAIFDLSSVSSFCLQVGELLVTVVKRDYVDSDKMATMMFSTEDRLWRGHHLLVEATSTMRGEKGKEDRYEQSISVKPDSAKAREIIALIQASGVKRIYFARDKNAKGEETVTMALELPPGAAGLPAKGAAAKPAK